MTHAFDPCTRQFLPQVKLTASVYIPRLRKKFYEFWWNQEADLPKTAFVEFNHIMEAAGRDMGQF
jgi:hypothetical protein